MEAPVVFVDMADNHLVGPVLDNLEGILEVAVDNLVAADNFEVVQAVGLGQYSDLGMIEHLVVVQDSQVVEQKPSVVQPQQHQEPTGQEVEGMFEQMLMVPTELSEKTHMYSAVHFHIQCTLMVDLLQVHNHYQNLLAVEHNRLEDNLEESFVAEQQQCFEDSQHPVDFHMDHLVDIVDQLADYHNWDLDSWHWVLLVDDRILGLDMADLQADYKHYHHQDHLLGLHQQHYFEQMQSFDRLVVLDIEGMVCIVEQVVLKFKNNNSIY